MAVIVLPGIKGTELVDAYPSNRPRRWSESGTAFDDPHGDAFDLALIEGRHDAGAEHWMLPSRLQRSTYDALLHTLRRTLHSEPVLGFGYDWRKPLEASARQLVATMDALQERECLARRDPTLRFVTHSMGGLLLRSALALRDRRQPFRGIGRIVFIAPPFRGSIGTPYSLVVGDRDPAFATTPDQRKVTRGFPSVYQMLPSWKGACVDEDGQPVDLFDPAAWQASVRQAASFRADFVRDAEAFVRGRQARHGGHSDAPMLADAAVAKAADRILILCAAGIPTPARLPVLTRNKSNPGWLDFAHLGTTDQGDGRVPLASAAIRGVPLAVFAQAGEHGQLCRDTRVNKLVCHWLIDGKAPMLRPRTPADPLKRRLRAFGIWDGKSASFGTHIA